MNVRRIQQLKRTDFMDATKRRNSIVSILSQENRAVSARKLASELNVSRQIIVGDVALLRASGMDVIATPKGYVLESESMTNKYIGKLASQHNAAETKDELYDIVDNGGEIVDVIVEHPVYGELKGRLAISSRYDADKFLEAIENKQANLLSELTDGVHLHTIACADKKAFERIKDTLENHGFIYKN